MRAILAAIVCAALAAPAAATPSARSPAECAVVGNMVAIAGVFAKNGWSQTDALALYPDLYASFYAARGMEAGEIARLEVASGFANRVKNPKETPFHYGQALAAVCMQLGGDLTHLLGVDS